MAAVLELRNAIRDYGWGSTHLMRELLGVPNPQDQPQAEMWLGAHPGAPSDVRVDGVWMPLPDYIARDPARALGREAAERFDAVLPFLFKVLAAGKPLSLQVHPDAAQAKAGFAREESQGIARDAANRSYRDDRHKPELLCALTRFEAMLGFRSPQEIRANVARLELDALEPVSATLEADPGAPALRRFFEKLLTADAAWQARVAREAARASERFSGLEAHRWVCALSDEYPRDIGVLAPLFLNVITLEPGEAVFLKAGELHSYLAGCGVEIMANSDNVLRGGLTPKHVDVAELLHVLSFEPGTPSVSRPAADARGDRVYRTPAREFELMCLASGESERRDDVYCVSGAEIVLCVDGEVAIEPTSEAPAMTLARGESAFIDADLAGYRVRGVGRLFRASIPT